MIKPNQATLLRYTINLISVISLISIGYFTLTNLYNPDKVGINFKTPQARTQSTKGEVLAQVSTGAVVKGCGNNIKEDSESCDGTDLANQSCISLGYNGGTLLCNSNCTFNTSNCTTAPPTCGNGIKESNEYCDLDDLGGATCITFGYLGGDLGCYTNCSYDKSGCLTDESSIIVVENPNDTDLDDDGLPDTWEDSCHCMQSDEDDASLDYDEDGLSNSQEFELGTDPCDNDTDADGMPDGWENTHSLNPLVNDANEDPDNDGITNINEYKNGTNPQEDDQKSSASLPTTGQVLKDASTNWLTIFIISTIAGTGLIIFIIVRVKKSKGKGLFE